ncbi:MAG: M20 family dipeptidase [Desulfobulbaceae bacterium]|nr:M20 family dipeptidase [Desulfobulbaceae bacterium]
MDTRNFALVNAIENYSNSLLFLKDLIAIPSVSTVVDRSSDVANCAQVISQKLTSLGIEHVQVFETAKHPVVYGDYLHADPHKPTILIYGHYDVQPVDPIELWNNPPFEATRSGDYLFARGASDMKGQFVACLAAIEAIMKTGDFPVNIKFILEGEEEIGSPSLKNFLMDKKLLLKSDVVLNPDTGMISADIPTIVYGGLNNYLAGRSRSFT